MATEWRLESVRARLRVVVWREVRQLRTSFADVTLGAGNAQLDPLIPEDV